MPRIIYLNQRGSGCFALEADDGVIGPYPFFAQDQVLEFLELDETDQVPVESFSWIPAPGGPPGYRLFARRYSSGHMSVVVLGPFGMLPGIYPSPEAAIGAADEDYRINSEAKPIIQKTASASLT